MMHGPINIRFTDFSLHILSSYFAVAFDALQSPIYTKSSPSSIPPR